MTVHAGRIKIIDDYQMITILLKEDYTMNDKERMERALPLLLRMKDCVRKGRMRSDDNGKTFLVLSSLSEYQSRIGRPATVSEIAHITGLALPNVSRLLTPIEQQGLIERVKEGRSVSIIITEQGNAVLADQRDVMLEGLGRALGELGDDELETYFAITEKILSSLEEYCEEGGADV